MLTKKKNKVYAIRTDKIRCALLRVTWLYLLCRFSITSPGQYFQSKRGPGGFHRIASLNTGVRLLSAAHPFCLSASYLSVNRGSRQTKKSHVNVTHTKEKGGSTSLVKRTSL